MKLFYEIMKNNEKGCKSNTKEDKDKDKVLSFSSNNN